MTTFYSGYTNVANATTPAAPPTAPTLLIATAVSAHEIDLSWTGGTGQDGYIVERSLDGVTGWTPVGSSATTAHADKGLLSGTTYYYRVYGYNGSGVSGYSNVANATTFLVIPVIRNSRALGSGGIGFRSSGLAYLFQCFSQNLTTDLQVDTYSTAYANGNAIPVTVVNGALVPLKGDRSAWDVTGYPTLHASDISTSAYTYHNDPADPPITGIPGTLDVSTVNNATPPHTHAITASANPGAASALLKSDAAGNLTLVSLNLGTYVGGGLPGTVYGTGTGTAGMTFEITDNGVSSEAYHESLTNYASIRIRSFPAGSTQTRMGIGIAKFGELSVTSGSVGNPEGLIIDIGFDKPIIFGTNNVERLRLDSGGVKIAAASALFGAYTLTMTGNSSLSGTNTGDQSGANPTASVGLTAVNGVAATFMRSDAAPPIDQGIVPTWTGIHTFGNTTDSSSTSTGAVVVSGGVGIAKNLTVGGTGGIGGSPEAGYHFQVTASVSAGGVFSSVRNSAAANTGNTVNYDMRLESSTQTRTAFILTASFSTTTDASRTSTVLFRTADAGTFATALTLVGKAATFAGNVGLTAKVTTYNNVATEGYGVGAIVDDVALTNQSADIGSTNFTNAGTAGTYMVTWYIYTTTADATAGTAILTITYNDGTTARSRVASSVDLTSTTTPSSVATSVIFARLGSGSVSYAVTHTGAYNNARYALYMSCIRLS